MHRLIIFIAVVAAVAVDAQSPYQYAVPYGGQGQVATGSIGAQYSQQNAATENHDKKNFGVNYSSDKGSSSNLKNVNAQVAGSGTYSQGAYPQYQQPQYPVNPYYNYGYPNYQYQQPQPVVPQVPLPPISQPTGGWGRY